MAKLPDPIYSLVPAETEILHQELESFDFANPPIDPVMLASDLHYTMAVNGGIGLSANQVGLPYKVFVVNSEPPMTVYNPVITWYDDSYSVMEEGCLSYPNLSLKVRRPEKIRIRFQDETGATHTHVLNGLVARVCQHEYDHLQGIDYTKRASALNVKRAKEKLKKQQRKMKRKIV